ncbi:MAG: ATP phosphoribosyltransferase regulatory subunit, partial [Actinomycetota bacterium]
MSKTQPARGMRDFLPLDIRKRNYVINIIREVYESYGFEPLETPAVENLETLTGKYGEEGNQLMFRILKRGEKLDASSGENLADLALRYDLTVPLARVVANYRNELPRFFKRYQIQPVWRADRPARGRYREFYQCDVDAIGSNSMIVEAELISAVSEILTRLGFDDFTIRVNHRKVLTGILETCGVPIEKHTDALVALDKIDKIGREGVEKELKERGISDDAGIKLLTAFEYFIKEKSDEIFDEKQKLKLVNLLKNQKVLSDELDQMVAKAKLLEAREDIQPSLSEFLKQSKNSSESYSILRNIKEFLSENETGSGGFEEIKELWLLANTVLGLIYRIKIDPTLARGLSYYTG